MSVSGYPVEVATLLTPDLNNDGRADIVVANVGRLLGAMTPSPFRSISTKRMGWRRVWA